MRNAKVILAVALLLGFCAVGQAAVLVDQTGTPWGGLLADTKANKEIADDFTLTGSSVINEIGINGHFDAGWDNASFYGFYLNVYNDASGAPGTVVSSQHITSGISVVGDAYTVPVSDISLGAGTYWLGVKADISTSGFTGEFKLKLANGDATNGNFSSDPGVTYVVSGSSSYNLSGSTLNGRYWHNDGTGFYTWYSGTYTGSFPTDWSTGNNSHPEGLDLSFTLSGTGGGSTIPEPSSVVLLGMGLVGLLAYAWRKRK